MTDSRIGDSKRPRIPRVLWFLCAIAGAALAGAEPLVIHGERMPLDVTPYVYALPDPQSALAIEDVSAPSHRTSFEPFTGARVNFGVIFGTYWMRFDVQNASNDPIEYFLVVERTTLDDVQLFVEKAGAIVSRQTVRSDTHLYDRPVSVRQPVFRLALDPGQPATCYLRFQTNGATGTNLTVVHPDLFRERESKRVVAMGIYFGFLLIMVAHYVVMFALFRDVGFLYLAATVAAMTVYVAMYKGFVFQFIWPEGENLSQRFTLPFAGIMFGCVCLFTVRFLDARKNAPRLAKALYLVVGVSFCIPVLNMISDAWTDRVAYSLGILTPILVLATAIKCVQTGRRSAWIFLSAWTVLLLSSVAYGLSGLDYIPETFVTSNGPLLATPIMLLMLSLATWDRFKSKEEEYRDTLEQRVEERTHELAEALQNVKTLEGLIPICAHCKKVRDDRGLWDQIEMYVATRTHAQFSHGVCPDCVKEHYPEVWEAKQQANSGN